MRNRVVHGYDTIDWNIVWDVAAVHSPALQRAIDDLLKLSQDEDDPPAQPE